MTALHAAALCLGGLYASDGARLRLTAPEPASGPPDPAARAPRAPHPETLLKPLEASP